MIDNKVRLKLFGHIREYAAAQGILIDRICAFADLAWFGAECFKSHSNAQRGISILDESKCCRSIPIRLADRLFRSFSQRIAALTTCAGPSMIR